MLLVVVGETGRRSWSPQRLCLWLGGDEFGLGEVRGQELSGSVQGGGCFVEDRVIGLEDVGHPGGEVEGDLDVGGGGLPGEADGVVEENLVRAGLDDCQACRQAGDRPSPDHGDSRAPRHLDLDVT